MKLPLIALFGCLLTVPSSADSPAPAAVASQTQAGHVVLMRPTESILVAADPGKVWKLLLSMEGMTALGFPADKSKTLGKVGDHAHATMQGDEGNLVVTHVENAKEWRAAWDPDKGHYVCSIRFQLNPEGKGTRLTFADWYSDEKPESAEATARESSKMMAQGMAKFKAMAEK